MTLEDEASRSQLVSTDIRIKGKTVRVRDPGRNVTNATIKDAPIKLKNDVITTSLSAYGHVVPGSLRMGKIRGSNILNGTRYVELLDVENTIPTEIRMAEYTARIYCDSGKTECKHCGDTSHPS